MSFLEPLQKESRKVLIKSSVIRSSERPEISQERWTDANELAEGSSVIPKKPVKCEGIPKIPKRSHDRPSRTTRISTKSNSRFQKYRQKFQNKMVKTASILIIQLSVKMLATKFNPEILSIWQINPIAFPRFERQIELIWITNWNPSNYVFFFGQIIHFLVTKWRPLSHSLTSSLIS